MICLLKRFIFNAAENRIFISLCSVAFYWTGYAALYGDIVLPPPPLLLIIFASAYWTYGLQPLQFTGWRNSAISIIALTVIAILSVVFLNWRERLLLLHLGVVAILYHPNFPSKNIGFRKIPYVKIFLIAYVWAAASSFFPALNQDLPLFNAKVLALFAAHFCFIVSITLPFDIRDFEADKRQSTPTLPHFFGERLTKIISLVLLGFFSILIFLIVQPFYLVVAELGFAALMVLRSGASRSKYFYLVGVDGLILAYFLLLVIRYA